MNSKVCATINIEEKKDSGGHWRSVSKFLKTPLVQDTILTDYLNMIEKSSLKIPLGVI